MSGTTTRHFAAQDQGFVRQRIEQLLSQAGISINGNNPWDIQVTNPAFYRRALVNGSLGLGESYMNEWWECEQIDEMMSRMLRSELSSNHKFVSHIYSWISASILNLQKQSRAFQVGKIHYDIGNDLYEAMLDKRMVYTCGYWADADNLDDAQEAKLDLVCRKLDLNKGMTVLDIGCGWGSLAKFAAENYGAHITGITVSKEQCELARERCEGLPVEIRLQDYREVTEKFDALVSLGMFEHVGHKNYGTYMRTAKKCLKDECRFLLHTIGKFDSRTGVDPWIGKYIFPNGEIPSLKQIAQSLESVMLIEDMHNFGPDYDKTLMSWFHNFDLAWPELSKRYSQRFYRMWKYYLHICAGAFRARDLQLWQFVISNGAPKNPYRRPE